MLKSCILSHLRFKLVILLSLLKEDEHGVEHALQYINNFQAESTVSKEVALKFLKLYVSPETLYKRALSTYDLGLALMTAQVTSMDPKEYVPYLGHLSEISPPYRNYLIDVDLKNNRKALENLLQCSSLLKSSGHDRLDETLTFVQRHELYFDTLQLLDPTNPRFNLFF